jgi:hypothetical protein
MTCHVDVAVKDKGAFQLDGENCGFRRLAWRSSLEEQHVLVRQHRPKCMHIQLARCPLDLPLSVVQVTGWGLPCTCVRQAVWSALACTCMPSCGTGLAQGTALAGLGHKPDALQMVLSHDYSVHTPT